MTLYRPLGNNWKIIDDQFVVRKSRIPDERKCVCVRVDGQDYQECKAATFWASEKKGDEYTQPDPFPDGTGDQKVAVGLFGEMAVAIFLGLDVDLEYKKGGDQYDFIIDEKEWDVKTARSKRKRPSVKASRYQRYCKVLDGYIVCYMISHHSKEEWAEIVIVGNFYKDDLETRGYVNSAYGADTTNFDLYFSESTPWDLE